ncbi:uncharacterized protein [Primulina eburnea]|uniref:uncharacterized protein n=1 Tax=Primulina eburnea TaxID=1245227 RepID=UPI003C6C3F83
MKNNGIRRVNENCGDSGQKEVEPQGSSNSKAQYSSPGGQKDKTMHAKAAKVYKILTKVVPKDAADFRRSPIQSMNNTDDEAEHGEGKGINNRSLPKYENVYCRRNKGGSARTFESCWEDEKNDPVIGSNVNNMYGGNHGSDNRVSLELYESEDDFLDNEFELSDTDSQRSLRSEESLKFKQQEKIMEGLFSPKRIETTIAPNPPELAKSVVGQVLTNFHSSLLNHSFKLHSFFPSSFNALGLSSGLLGGGGVRVDELPGHEKENFQVLDSERKGGTTKDIRKFREDGKCGDQGKFSPVLLKKDLNRLRCEFSCDRCSSSKGHEVFFMKILTWNIRGGGNVKKRELVRTEINSGNKERTS